MPTQQHEVPLEFVDRRPALIPELLTDILGVPLPNYAAVSVASADLTRVEPTTERRVDRVVHLRNEEGGLAAAVIVEVQNWTKNEARRRWPANVATLWERIQRPVYLLVICPKADVARWAANPIRLGHPGLTLTPLVAGPDGLPVIKDPAEVAENPELAVLSVLAHGGDREHGKLVVQALVEGFDDMAKGHSEGTVAKANRYLQYVYDLASKELRLRLEEIMATETFRYTMPFLKEAQEEGEAKGEARGRAAGEVNAVLTVLATRGITVDAEARQRIEACTDTDQLEQWISKAVTVQSIDELFE